MSAWRKARGARRRCVPALALAALAAAPAAAAAEAGSYVFRVAQGEAVSSAVMVKNACAARHTFKVSAPKMAWVRFEEDAAELSIEGGSARSVPLRFESAGLAPGVHRGHLQVDCLTCDAEQTFVEQVGEETAVRVCESSRQHFRVEMTVVEAPTQNAAGGAPPAPPSSELRNIETAMRSRMADALGRLAGKRGLTIQPESLTVLSLPEGGLLAGAWLAGFEELPAARLAAGAEVMFLHLERPEGPETGGDYTLAVRIGATTGAQLLDAQGAVVQELEVATESAPDGTVYTAHLAPGLTLPVWCTAPAASHGWTLRHGWPVRCLVARP